MIAPVVFMVCIVVTTALVLYGLVLTIVEAHRGDPEARGVLWVLAILLFAVTFFWSGWVVLAE